MILIKSPQEIQRMRESGKILSEVHSKLREALKEGITTYELDMLASKVIQSHNAKSSFLGYSGYPANTCISINDVVIHGIPSKNTIIKNGDVVSIDMGVYKDGFHSDAARTYIVGSSTAQVQELVDRTKESFYKALEFCREGFRISDIGHAIEEYLRPFNYGIIRDFTGHGVGSSLHEDPAIPNYGRAGFGPRLKAGMTLAIEPMVTLGTHRVRILDDNWTVKTIDGSISSHYENTVLITKEEPEILTNQFEVNYHG